MYTAALYWKNRQTVNLTDGNIPASASAVFVDNDDVYISGYEGNVAKYWKNGEAVDINDGSNQVFAESIFVSDGDIYIAGSEDHGGLYDVIKYWKKYRKSVVRDIVWIKMMR